MIINPNHNGRTQNGKYAYRPLVQVEPNDFDPNSLYWRRRFETASDDIVPFMNDDEWDKWYDATIPEDATLRQMAELVEAKLTELKTLVQ